MEALILYLLLPTSFVTFIVIVWKLIDTFVVRSLRDIITGASSDE